MTTGFWMVFLSGSFVGLLIGIFLGVIIALLFITRPHRRTVI